MKKIYSIFVALCLMIGALFGLTACGGDKLPKTDYEKVAFAFNGVESSIRKAISSQKSNKNNVNTHSVGSSMKLASPMCNRLQGGIDTPTDVLDAISRVYVPGDSQGDTIDGLEFNEPPMIQFQCIKSVLKDVGKSYIFGTKYYNTITGDVYLDTATGFKVSASDPNANDYKYAYTFVFAISIDIDEEDNILANISFDITLSKGTERYSTYWYVEMHLDYDMTSATPNYELLMLTANDEKDLPYYGHYVYEHDYVKVDNNKISEWRKFVMDTDEEIKKDATHQTFDAYMNEGISFRADTCKWYKNKDLKKVTRLTDDKEESIAKSFYTLGLNSTDIDGSRFRAKEGVEAEVIKKLYNTISTNFRQDVIYNLVCRDEDDIAHDNNGGNNGGQQAHEISSIRFRNSSGSSFWENGTIKGGENNNPTIEILLSDYNHGGSTNVWNCLELDYPTIWYFDEYGGDVRRVTSDELQNFSFALIMSDSSCDIGINDSIIDKIIEFGESVATSTSKISIEFVDNEKNVRGELQCEINGDIMNTISARFRGQFPTDLDIPEYLTTNGSFSMDGKYLNVSNTDENERNAYIGALDTAAYGYIGSNVYIKIIDDGATAQKVYVSGVDNGVVTISVEEEPNTYSTSWNASLVNTWTENKLVEFPVPGASIYKFGNNDQKNVYAYCVDWDEYSNALEEAGLAYAISENAYYYYFNYDDTYYCIEVLNESNGLVCIDFNLYNNVVNFEPYGMKYKIGEGSYVDFVVGVSNYVPSGLTYIATGVVLQAYDIITFASIDEYLHVILENDDGRLITDYENSARFQAKQAGKYTFIVTIYNDNGQDCHIYVENNNN